MTSLSQLATVVVGGGGGAWNGATDIFHVLRSSGIQVRNGPLATSELYSHTFIKRMS